MFKIRKQYRKSEGAVMAEFAISIPLLLGILFMIIEFGTVLSITNSLNQIATAAARYAATNVSYDSAALETAANVSTVLSQPDNLTLTFSPSSGVSIGDAITVTATYTYTPTFNLYAILSPGSMSSWAPTLSTEAVARAEVASNQ